MRRAGWFLALLVFPAGRLLAQDPPTPGAHPGSRVVLDAHNCYPYGDWWADRIDRALSTGTPLAIEQDLAWFTDTRSGRSRSVLSHDAAPMGSEPGMKEYFFERVRPIVERAIAGGDRTNWPLITLNLDLKTTEPAHLDAIWTLLNEYRDWITSAPRSADIHTIGPLDVRPILVLTGESDEQKAVFYDGVPVNARLLVFGATPTHVQDPAAPARTLSPEPMDNYHRWWNNPWRVVEPEGQNAATGWSEQKEKRLTELVQYAHERGLWIRFYTLDGESVSDESSHGWFHSYNFGSSEAARARWQAAIRAGADFVAVDQYEDFAKELRGNPERHSSMVLEGSLTRADFKRLMERDFDVAAGTKRLKITLKYSGSDRGTVIDLGLRGPAGFRGWSGGGAQSIVVGPTFASYGYLPGPIESGHWAVILGIPNIREGSIDTYSVTVEQDDSEAPVFPVIHQGPGWFTGDFHSHSGHSDGRAELSNGSRVKIPVHRVFDAARQAGLDFIALSDHNTSSHWTEVDRLQPYYGDLLLLHAREITTYQGHFNAVGEQKFVDFRVGINRSVATIADEITEGGAFVSINHPGLPDDERCMGCGWSALGAETMRRMNGLEIVNGDIAEGPLAGWPVWAKMLNAGLHLTAIGGSDEHTADETRDHAIGIPATVVYAEELSEPALLQGLRKGRAYVRTRGPAGPTIQFEAVSRGTRWEMGETIPNPATDVILSITVSRAPGQRVQWIRNGEIISTAPLTEGQSASLPVNASPGDWFSVILRDDTGPTLFSNAIYVAR
jgi:hypothetical protein